MPRYMLDTDTCSYIMKRLSLCRTFMIRPTEDGNSAFVI